MVARNGSLARADSVEIAILRNSSGPDDESVRDRWESYVRLGLKKKNCNLSRVWLGFDGLSSCLSLARLTENNMSPWTHWWTYTFSFMV